MTNTKSTLDMQTQSEPESLPMPKLSELMNGKAGEPWRRFSELIVADEVIRLRSLSELDRAKFAGIAQNSKGEFDAERAYYQSAFLMMLSICDSEDNLNYCETHLDGLANLPASMTIPIVEAIWQLNGVYVEPAEAKKNLATTGADS